MVRLASLVNGGFILSFLGSALRLARSLGGGVAVDGALCLTGSLGRGVAVDLLRALPQCRRRLAEQHSPQPQPAQGFHQ